MNMIEKVAKAIFENDWEREWSTAENYEREHFIKTAKAAIEAMLEPTEGMINAGTSETVQSYYRQLIQAALEGK